MIFKQFVFIISAGGHELLSFSCCRKSNWTLIISSIIMYFLLLWWPHYPAWLPLIFNKDDSRTIISNRWTHNLLHNIQLDNDSKSKKSHIVSARCQDEYFVTNMRWRQRSDLHWDLLLWSVKLGLFVKIFYFVSRFSNVFIMTLCTTVWSNCDNNQNHKCETCPKSILQQLAQFNSNNSWFLLPIHSRVIASWCWKGDI